MKIIQNLLGSVSTALRLVHHLEMHLVSTTIIDEDLTNAMAVVFVLTKKAAIGRRIVKVGERAISLGLLLALQGTVLEKSVKIFSQ